MADAHRVGDPTHREVRDAVVEDVLGDRLEQIAAAMLVAQPPPVDAFIHGATIERSAPTRAHTGTIRALKFAGLACR